MPQLSRQIALVTGANRGIGLEVCRQLAKNGFTVILGSRDLNKGQDAARALSNEGLTVLPLQLDVTDQASVDAAESWVEIKFKVLDVLINNPQSSTTIGNVRLGRILTLCGRRSRPTR